MTGSCPAATSPNGGLYVAVMRALHLGAVPSLVGGTYALELHAGFSRDTNDLDLFVRREDWDRAAATLREARIDTELVFPHWLGKARDERGQVDLIFASGNGIAVVDQAWFDHASPGVVFGEPVLLSPAEEMIWSKSFVMERERYDGADVLHIVRARGRSLDWERLLARFADHWRVLFAHVVLFDYVYPGERGKVPSRVRACLLQRLARDNGATHDVRLCRGTLLSRGQYLVDVGDWGYEDARLQPYGPIAEGDLDGWNAAAWQESSPTRAR